MSFFLDYTQKGTFKGDCYNGVRQQLTDDFAPGLYKIHADGGSSSKTVFCDNGGWTVFQSRGHNGNPVEYFNRKWAAYREGFGDPS